MNTVKLDTHLWLSSHSRSAGRLRTFFFSNINSRFIFLSKFFLSAKKESNVLWCFRLLLLDMVNLFKHLSRTNYNNFQIIFLNSLFSSTDKIYEAVGVIIYIFNQTGEKGIKTVVLNCFFNCLEHEGQPK